ncbi:2,3-bisphosphoglycerate-independent phosphoglycerate mutase, partial [Candidatus Falkowbacteria bacterium]|nr:2,3-bisphosphoglycerate-independent phosphoglycerate mutase [Candidatus Falkowbacteria bacterium]
MKKAGNNENLPFVLVILDGWGIAKPSDSNAIYLAKKPTYDHLIKRYPNTTLLASGKNVGLPNGQDGNSEAGHMNIGAGRVAKQDAVIVNDMIKDGSFFKSRVLFQALNHAKKYKSNVHLMGLLSNGQSAHSEPRHLYALLKFFADNKFHRVYLHLFTDGRDSSQHAAARLISKLI